MSLKTDLSVDQERRSGSQGSCPDCAQATLSKKHQKLLEKKKCYNTDFTNFSGSVLPPLTWHSVSENQLVTNGQAWILYSNCWIFIHNFSYNNGCICQLSWWPASSSQHFNFQTFKPQTTITTKATTQPRYCFDNLSFRFPSTAREIYFQLTIFVTSQISISILAEHSLGILQSRIQSSSSSSSS